MVGRWGSRHFAIEKPNGLLYTGDNYKKCAENTQMPWEYFMKSGNRKKSDIPARAGESRNGGKKWMKE